MKALCLTAVVAWAALPAIATPANNLPTTPQDGIVATAAETFFKDSCHVGLSMAVYNRGTTRFYNYGTTSKSRPSLPTQRTLYEIGSVTKTFTGVLASKAILDGRMTLDGDFRSYLAEPYPNLELDGKPITLRTLTAHTSGMPRDIPDNSDLFQNPDFDTLPDKLIARERDYDRARYLRELHQVKLAATPGTTFNYSNIGMKLVGFGLEQVYGDSYGQLLNRHITAPLGMKHTALSVRPLDRRYLAQGYGATGRPTPYHLANAGAAGGLYSDTEDMIRYATWHLDESDPLIRQSHTVIAGTLSNYGRGMNWNMATTSDIEGKVWDRKIWQSGGLYGMSSQVILFPDSREAYVLLANDACFKTQSELETIALTVHAALKPAPLPAAWPSQPPADIPFEASQTLTGITFTGRHAQYTTADTWYPSWAADGNLYSPWTDGMVGDIGSGSYKGAEATTGYATITGDDPLHLTITGAGTVTASAAPYGGRYPAGSLVHNGVWYYGTYALDQSPDKKLNWDVLGPFIGFRTSTDNGATWRETRHTPDNPLFPEPARRGSKVKMGVPHFVDFGRNMQYSPDGKAYLVAHGASDPDPQDRDANLSWITADEIYLARVTPDPATIDDASAYEYFTGYDSAGQPLWTHDFTRIKPLLRWNNHMGSVAMTYDAPLGKYLMAITDGTTTVGKFNTYILESAAMTGPWKLVTYMKDFGEQAYFVNFPSKFISPDGKTAWLSYSANFSNLYMGTDFAANPPGSGYQWVLQEVRLTGPEDTLVAAGPNDTVQNDTETAGPSVAVLEQDIAASMPDLLTRYAVPGAAVAVIHDGKVVWTRGFGLSDVAAARPMTVNTAFNAGSISKSPAAWAVMRLAEQGRIDLDAPVDTYLKRWHLPPSDFDNGQVTVRRLLSHTSGISEHDFHGWDPATPLPAITDILSGKTGTGEVRVISQPGAGFRYSGANYMILALLVEDVTSQPFATYTAETVFRPLGMTQTRYGLPGDPVAMATGYDALGNPQPALRYNELAAAGLTTNVHDLAAFAAAALPQEHGPTAGRGVLKPETLAAMETAAPNSRWADADPFGPDPQYGYGYTVRPEQFNGETGIGHGGSNRGWESLYQIIPATGDGIVIMTNSSNGSAVIADVLCLWRRWQATAAPCPQVDIAIPLYAVYKREGVAAAVALYRRLRRDEPAGYDLSLRQLNGMGYQLLRTGDLAGAIEIFKLNVEAWPGEWNVHDSLGEAYAKAGDTANAIASYRTSLRLNPGNDNGRQALKALGAGP